jgi:hypothetical protein
MTVGGWRWSPSVNLGRGARSYRERGEMISIWPSTRWLLGSEERLVLLRSLVHAATNAVA